MPVIQQQPPVVIQGIPGAQTMPRLIPVNIQQPGAFQTGTLPMGATTLPIGTTLQPANVAPVQQQVVRQKPAHIPLARCRVLYLGSAVPLDTSHGIDAVQGPCRERYPFEGGGDVNGIDSWVSVFSSGMLLSYVNDKKGVTWFPIQSLYVCAAVKCVISVDGLTGEKNAKFVALDSEEAKGSKHPPMFAAIMRRTKGVKVLECHVFIAKSAKAAMALTQSCTHAYEHKEGWTDEPPQLQAKTNAPTRLVPADKQEEKEEDEQAPPEFYQKPPPQGYYYTSNKDLVKNYNVFGNDNKERAGSDQGSRRSPQQPAAGTLPPPGAPGGPVPVQAFYPPPPGSMMGPPGAPVPPMPGPPPQGMVGPPPPGMYPYPGMGYPMPPPPPGYFNDWDRFEGRPVAVFGERPGYGPPPPMREGPPPPMREPEVRIYREDRPPREYDPRDDYRRVEYREPPPQPRVEYRPPMDDYRGPPPREEYRRPRDVYRHESPPRQSKRSGRERVASPSPPRREVVREPRYESRRQPEMRREPDYRDQRTYGRYEEERRNPYEERYRDDPSDLVLYAPRYQERFPTEYTDGRDVAPPRRRDGREHVEYTSNFNPEIVMKGNRDYRENGRPTERTGYVREDDDPYRYERDLPGADDRRYPRQERGFGRSLQEERDTIGDNFSEAYRNDLDGESANIEYGMFRGNDRDQNRDRGYGHGPSGRPFDNLENTLGYYP